MGGAEQQVVIRGVPPGDVEAVVEIALAAWEPFFEWLKGRMGQEMFACFCPDWRAEKERQVRETCAGRDTGIALVAEHEGRIVGFVTYYRDPDAGRGEIGNNAVHPDHQGHGIGTAMCKEVLRRLREEGIRFVKVCTGGDPFHAHARRVYEKAGFGVSVPGVEFYRAL
jgi:GNAT superfamily N-acetyltransferase